MFLIGKSCMILSNFVKVMQECFNSYSYGNYTVNKTIYFESWPAVRTDRLRVYFYSFLFFIHYYKKLHDCWLSYSAGLH
jgi:hypothetical protein